MPLTRDFKETVQLRVQSDPDFREAMLREAVECMLNGEVEVGRSILRDYINAAIGFAELAERTGKRPQSLMRMFSANGNPRADNLLSAIRAITDHEGIELGVSMVPRRVEDEPAVVV